MRGTSACKLIFALSPLVTTPHCGTVYYRVCVSRGYPGRDRETGIDLGRISANPNEDDGIEATGGEVKRAERGVGRVKQEERRGEKERKKERERKSDGRGEWPCSDTDH